MTAKISESTFTVYSMGLCMASVCTSLSVEEAAARLNIQEPAGGTLEWRLADEPFRTGEPNPCPCNDGGGNRHMLFEC